MATQKILIADASAKQLADFAENALNLEGINYRMGTDAILSKMRVAMYDKDFIEVAGEEARIQRIDPPRPQSARRMATIRIYNQETPGGTEPVPVAVNGKQMFIPRDRDCEVPWEYYHALDNAKKYVYEQDAALQLNTSTRKEVHEYPFSLIRQDPDTEAQKAA